MVVKPNKDIFQICCGSEYSSSLGFAPPHCTASIRSGMIADLSCHSCDTCLNCRVACYSPNSCQPCFLCVSCSLHMEIILQSRIYVPVRGCWSWSLPIGPLQCIWDAAGDAASSTGLSIPMFIPGLLRQWRPPILCSESVKPDELSRTAAIASAWCIAT